MPVVTLVRVVSASGASGARDPAGAAIEAVPIPLASGARADFERFVVACGDAAGLQPRGTLAALATRPGRHVRCRVARASGDHGDILGVVAITAAGDATPRHSITWLLVHPLARRRGIGTALVAAALEDVRAAGGAAVWVETAADWDAAAFWQAAGFHRAGRATDPVV